MLSDLDLMPSISDLEAEHPGALEVADPDWCGRQGLEPWTR
jgi:hypothetical protein